MKFVLSGVLLCTLFALAMGNALNPGKEQVRDDDDALTPSQTPTAPATPALDIDTVPSPLPSTYKVKVGDIIFTRYGPHPVVALKGNDITLKRSDGKFTVARDSPDLQLPMLAAISNKAQCLALGHRWCAHAPSDTANRPPCVSDAYYKRHLEANVEQWCFHEERKFIEHRDYALRNYKEARLVDLKRPVTTYPRAFISSRVFLVPDKIPFYFSTDTSNLNAQNAGMFYPTGGVKYDTPESCTLPQSADPPVLMLGAVDKADKPREPKFAELVNSLTSDPDKWKLADRFNTFEEYHTGYTLSRRCMIILRRVGAPAMFMNWCNTGQKLWATMPQTKKLSNVMKFVDNLKVRWQKVSDPNMANTILYHYAPNYVSKDLVLPEDEYATKVKTCTEFLQTYTW